MNALRTQTTFLLLGALSILTICRTSALAAPLPIAATTTEIAFAIGPGDDIVTDLQNLASASHVPINIEVLHTYDVPARLVVPGFSLAAKYYTVEQILATLQASAPGFRWQSDGTVINIVLQLSQGVKNPFDANITKPLSGSWTPEQWIDKFGAIDPPWGLAAVPGELIWGQDSSRGTTGTVTLSIPAGTNLREAMNELAAKANLRWISFVKDFNPVGGYRIVNGVRVNSDVNLPYSLIGRTSVWYGEVGNVTNTLSK